MFFHSVSDQWLSRNEESLFFATFVFFFYFALNQDLLKSQRALLGRSLHRTLEESSLHCHWPVVSSLIVSSFTPINSTFSHAWHFLFKKANHEVKSHPQDVNYWHLACQASSGQMPGIPRARKQKKALCNSELSVSKKRERVMWRLILCVSTSSDNTGVLAEGRRPPVGGHRSCHNPKGQRKG